MITDLEKVLDHYTSLACLLGDLATICSEKSDHTLKNRQDTQLSEEWNYASEGIKALAGELHV